MTTLTVNGVSTVLGDRTVVSAVSLSVGAGEVVGLVGPNGSGKSTLLRNVYRVLRPRAGAITLDGDDVWDLSARQSAQRTAVVVQEPAGDFDFAVRDIVMMGRTPHLSALARPSGEDDRIVDDSLARVEATPLAGRLFRTLSGGEKQRVLVARALAQRSTLLILDEPTNHLDIRHQIDLLELIRQLGLATLTALHDLNLAAEYCDRLYVLQGGAVVAEGPPGEVLAPDLIGRVFGVGAARYTHPVTGRPQLAFYPPGRDATDPG